MSKLSTKSDPRVNFKNNQNVPEHERPSPLYPFLQEQL